MLSKLIEMLIESGGKGIGILIIVSLVNFGIGTWAYLEITKINIENAQEEYLIDVIKELKKAEMHHQEQINALRDRVRELEIRFAFKGIHLPEF
jgi:hypothetical protein